MAKLSSLFSLLAYKGLRHATGEVLGLSDRTAYSVLESRKGSSQLARHFLLYPRVGLTFVKKLPFRFDDGYWTARVPAYIGEVLKGCNRQVL